MSNNYFECSAVEKGCEIEITNHCGLDCFGCVRKDSVNFWFLNRETLVEILEYIRDKDYQEIVLSGLGDVFLHKELYQLIDMIFESYPNIRIYIMTKWQTVTIQDIGIIKKYNQQGKNIGLTFSIFSLKADEYKKVTGWGNLEYLLDIIKASFQNKIHFNFEFFIDKKTILHVESFRKFASVFWKQFHYTVPHNWWGKLSHTNYKRIFDKKLLSDYVDVRSQWDICEAFSWDYLFFDYSWSVYKCWLKRDSQDLYLGNISQQKDMKNVSQLDYSTCKSCSYYLYKTKTW